MTKTKTMTYRIKEIFPEDWNYILEIYREFQFSLGCRNIPDEVMLLLLETGVRFGERLSQLPLEGFVEIGCGLAIPSLTLAKLGNNKVRAIDIDPGVMAYAGKLIKQTNCEVEIQCCDIFTNRPELQKGHMLIAEKPASYKKNILEVENHIRNWCAIENNNLAMIPSYLKEDTLSAYSERCEKYQKKLRQVGFKAESRQICERLPFQWVIAIK